MSTKKPIRAEQHFITVLARIELAEKALRRCKTLALVQKENKKLRDKNIFLI